jgi:hypothetical protein
MSKEAAFIANSSKLLFHFLQNFFALDRFSLQSTAEQKQFLHHTNISLSEINPQFFDTPGMTMNPNW